MSNVIEENKIILTFDKEDFDKNTASAIKTLDALKEKLTGSATLKSVESLARSTQKFNLDGMADSINTVGKRMKFMGVVGASVINRLTNNAVTSGIQIAKALPQQIIQGGWNRAMNIEKAQFLIEGLGYTWKNTAEQAAAGAKDIFTAVDNAVTGTAYALDEAALVASNFLSSGITDIDKLEKSLKAVSGLASVVSADYGDIGRIYAQVAGQGRMMGDDLLQLSQRGIGAASEIAKYLNKNKDVAKQATDTAIAQGKQVKKMEEIQTHAKITEADVREMVSAGAISFDILVGATQKFFKQAQKANDTYSGSLSNLKSAFNRLGETFEGSKLKNLTRIFNALIPVVKRLKIVLEPFTTWLSNTSTKATDIAVKAIKSLAKTMGVDFKDAETKGFFRFAQGLSRFKKDTEDTKKSIDKGNKDLAKGAIVTAKEWQAALDIWYKGSYGTGQKRANEIRKLGMSYENVQGIINKFYKNKFDWDKTKKEYQIGDNTKEQEKNNKAVAEGAKEAKNQNEQLSALGMTVKGTINLIKSFSNVIKITVNTFKVLKNLFTGFGDSAFGNFASLFLKATNSLKKFTSNVAKTIKIISEGGDEYKKLAEKNNILVFSFTMIGHTVKAVANVFSTMGKVANKIFGTFRKAVKNVKDGKEELTGLEKVFKGLLNLKSAFVNFAYRVFDIIAILQNAVGTFVDKVGNSGIGQFFSMISDKIGSAFLYISEKILAVSEKILKFTRALAEGGKEIDKTIAKGGKLGKIFEKFKELGGRIKNAFKEIGNVINNKAIQYFEKVKDIFESISNAFHNTGGLGIVVGLFSKLGEALANFLEGLASGENTTNSFFGMLGSFANEFLSVVSNAFEWILDHIGPAIDKIVNFFKQLSQTEGFGKLKDALYDAASAMKQMAGSGFEKVVNWLKEIGALTVNNANMSRLIDFFSDMSSGVADFVTKISKGESPIKSFFDTWAKTKEVMSFKYQAKKSIGEQFSSLVNAPALASSLNQIRKMDAGGKSLKAAKNLTDLGESLADGLSGESLDAITGKYFKDIKEGNWDKVSKVALRIVSIGAIIKSTKDLGSLAASLGGISKSISGFFNSLSGISTAIQKGIRIESFRTMAIAIALIAASIAALAVIPLERMLPAAGVILSFFLMMYAVLKLTTKEEFNPRNMLDVGAAFAGMGAGAMMLAFAVAAIGKLDVDQVGKGVAAIMAFMAGMLAISHFGKAIFGVGETFLALALGVTILIVAIKAFAKMEFTTVAKGVAIISGVMLALSLAARVAGTGAKGCASFFAIAAALYALVPAIVLMALIPFKRAMQGALAISMVMLALGGAARLATTGEGMKSMAAMASTIGVLAASLIVLSFINPDRLAGAVLSLMSVVVTVAAAADLMSAAKAAAGMMIAVIAAITGAIVLLIELDADSATRIAISLAVFAAAMGVACALLAVAGAAAPAALAGIGIMAILLGSVLLIVELLGVLNKYTNAGTAIEEGGKLLGKLGNALGQFVSGFAGGAIDGLADKADELKQFTNVFIPLVNSLSNMNTDGVKALRDLAEAILMITGGGILDKLGSKFGGQGSSKGMEGFGESLDSLAENFIPFVKKLNSGEGIGKEAIGKVKSFGEAIKVFSDISSALPKTTQINFGLFKGKFGEVEALDDFADDVKTASKKIIKAAENADDMSDDKVTKIGLVGKALSKLSDVASQLPQVGAFPTLKGKHDLGAFAKDLGDLVPNFKTLSDAVNGEGDNAFGDLSGVSKVGTAIGNMAKAAELIPENATGFHPIAGKKNMEAFVQDMGDMVPSFKTFSDAVAGVGDNAFSDATTEKVSAVAGAITSMANAAAAIPADLANKVSSGASLGGAINGSGGGGGLAKFAEDLGSFIDPFYTFSYKVGKHNKVFSADNLNMVGRIGEALGKFAEVKEKIAGVVEKTGGSLFDFGGETGDSDSLTTFGSSLESLSGNLQTFIEQTKGLVEDDIKEAASKISSITSIFDAFQSIGGETAIKIPTGEEFVTFAQNMYEFGQQMTTVEVDDSKFSTLATYLSTFNSKLEGIDLAAIGEKAKVVGTVGDAIGSFITAVGDKIPTGKNLVSLGENIKTFCDNLNGADESKISSKADEVKKAVKKLAAAAKQAAGTEGSGADLSKSGRSVGASYVSGLDDKVDAAKKKGKALAKAAKDGANDSKRKEEMKTVGQQLGNGIAVGLENAADRVKKAADKIVADAKRAAEAAGEVQSPSRVFMRIGNFLGEGLAKGIEAYGERVYKASYDMASSSVTAANLAIQGLEDVASPTITPVIDLSNVRKGANRINALVSSSKAIDINANVNASSSRYATPGMVAKLFDKIDEMSSQGVNVNVADGMNGAQIVNNFDVDGAENPEEFANRLARQLTMQMRMS